MSRQDIRFNGMNRNSNVSDSRPGDCEELINVRSENGALKIVKDKHEVSVNIPYKDVIIHDISGVRNYIGKDSSGWVWFSPETGLVLMRLYEGTDNVFVATLDNQLVISDKANIKTVSFIYADETYKEFGKDISFDVETYRWSSWYPGDDIPEEFILSPSKMEYIDSCRSFINKFKNENDTFCEGMFLYAFTITMYDGKETGMYGLTAVSGNVQADRGAANAFIDISGTGSTSGGATNIVTKFRFDQFFQKHTLTTGANESLFKQYENLIKSVNLYVSLPITRMPVNESTVEIKDVTFNNYSNKVTVGEAPEFIITPLGASETGAEKSLLYKQKSWTLKEFCEGIEHTIKFGGDKQATGKTMEVSTAYLQRAGRLFSYNKRIHAYDSSVKLSIPLGNMYQWASDDYDDITADVYVFLMIDGREQVIKYSDITLATKANDVLLYPAVSLPDMIVYSDSRAFKMVIVTSNTSIEGYSKFELSIDLQSSPAYNYAYAFADNTGMTPSNFDEFGIDLDNTYNEAYAINVTAQGNPMVYPVEHSYLFGGTIKALAYATEPISQSQIGQYPLYVFTDKGIYAMEQGSGTVLYANQVMVNTDKCDDDVTQTRNGVVYKANGSIYILSGRNSLNISLPVSGPIDKDIRKAVAYTQCCLNDKLYNVADNISQVEFQDYIPDARLVYIPYRDELVVSNPQYKYSYVFSFIYKTWHKISESLSPVGDNIVQRAIFTSSAVAKAATGEIIVANAVITPEHSFTAMQRAIYSGSDFQSGMNERYALVIDDVQVSSVYVRYPARLALIIAMLCKDVPYLDCMYDGASQYIFSSIAFDEGGQVELIQSDTGYTVFSITFDEHESVVSIPDKAVGGTISVNSSKGGSASTRKIIDGDSVVSLAAELNSSINGQAALGVHSDVGLNTLSLTASAAGAAGNGITLTLNAGNYVSLYHTRMSGGKDVTLEPGDYSILVDYTREKESTKVVHLQSRPMSFSQAYSIMRRMILHCKASITSPDNLSLYLFASNNLNEWQCVAASQKSDVTLDHIRLQRAARAYRYYIVIIGGQIYTTTELSYIMMEIEERFESKIR